MVVENGLGRPIRVRDLHGREEEAVYAFSGHHGTHVISSNVLHVFHLRPFGAAWQEAARTAAGRGGYAAAKDAAERQANPE